MSSEFFNSAEQQVSSINRACLYASSLRRKDTARLTCAHSTSYQFFIFLDGSKHEYVEAVWATHIVIGNLTT